VSTSLLVSTGALSCYPASMVHFFWFTDEKCSSYQHQATWGHKIRHLAIQKLNHLAISVCCCTVLLEGIKVKLSPWVCKSDRFGHFCGCNGKTSPVCRHWTRWSSPLTQGSYSATVSIGCDKLYSQHIMTSALHHD